MTYEEEVDGGDDSLHLLTIQQACQRFEAAWTQESRPELRDYLGELAGDARRHALCELLLIEWDRLRRRGLSAKLEDYQARFAEYVDVVDEAWRSDFGRTVVESTTSSTRGQRYTILKSHARGGFGQVYVARDEEFGREVALKEIQTRHANNHSIQQRFVREARITGTLEHPGIVPVYSAGKKPDGTPFYAMRFVEGESLKAAIDQFHTHHPRAFHAHAFRQLLSRFVSICNVMDYAHSRGVLHRDLKPGNIMLGKHGETLVVDWGLAKEAGHPEPSDTTIGRKPSPDNVVSFTTHGALIGTVSYMSPEQAAGKLGELTSASDIYSLGATLYHLLAGRAPLANERQCDALMTRIQRGEIPRVRTVQPAIPAPLDAICATAMALDPADRYPSAAALALDLEHWLADETVSTYVEPLPGMASRWARRHPTAIATGILGLLLVTLASAVIAVLIVFSNRQLAEARAVAENRRGAALAAQAAAEKARSEAEIERDLSKSIADFMVKCFRSPDPELDGQKITVAELLDRSFEDLRENTEISPSRKARFLEALAASNRSLGLHSQSLCVAEYGWEFSRKHLNPNDTQLISMRIILANALLEDYQLARAVAHFEITVDESTKRLGRMNKTTIEQQQSLATAYDRAGRIREAMALAQQALRMAEVAFGSNSQAALDAKYTLALILVNRGDFASALSILDSRVTQLQRTLRANHPDILSAQNSLANAYEASGRFDEAMSLQKMILESRRNELGNMHPSTLNSQNNLASTLLSAGRYSDAIELFESTVQFRSVVFGKEHPITLRSNTSLAGALVQSGKYARALSLLQHTLESQSRQENADYIGTIRTQQRLASALIGGNRVDEAIALINKCLPNAEQRLGPRHRTVCLIRGLLAQAYRRSGRPNAAVAIYNSMLPSAIELLGADHPEIAILESNLATALTSAGEFDSAALVFEKSLKHQEDKFGSNHPGTLQTALNLGICLARSGANKKAMDLFERYRRIVVDALGWDHPLVDEVHLGLANCYDQMGRDADAMATYSMLVDQLTVTLGLPHDRTITAIRQVSDYLFRKGRYLQAAETLVPVIKIMRDKKGVSDEDVMHASEEMAACLRCGGQLSEADKVYGEIVDAQKQRGKEGSVGLARNLYWLGVCQLEQDHLDEAEATFKQCWELRKRFIPGDWSTAVAESMLGFAMAKQGQFDAAEVHVISAFDAIQVVRDAIPSLEQERTARQATERVIELYEMWGKHPEVQMWRERANVASGDNRPMLSN